MSDEFDDAADDIAEGKSRLPAWLKRQWAQRPAPKKGVVKPHDRWPWIGSVSGLGQQDRVIVGIRRRGTKIDMTLDGGEILMFDTNLLGSQPKTAAVFADVDAVLPEYTKRQMALLRQQITLAADDVIRTDRAAEAVEWGNTYLRNALSVQIDLDDRPALWKLFLDLLHTGHRIGETDADAYASRHDPYRGPETNYITARRSLVPELPDGRRLIVTPWFQRHVHGEYDRSVSTIKVNEDMLAVDWQRYRNPRGALTAHDPKVPRAERTGQSSKTMYFWEVPADWEARWVHSED